MNLEKVPGRNAGNISLYALSTCPWCRKTKQLLADLGVAYQFVDVDLLPDADKCQAMETIRQCNPTYSFPTMLLDGGKCIIGFKEKEIRETFKS